MPPQDRDHPGVELVWPGKTTEVQRASLPFQTIERVNEVTRSADGQARLRNGGELPEWWPEDWRNKLIWGDNKYVLSSLLEEFAGQVDLIYIDPPFATGTDFTYKVSIGDVGLEKQPTAMEELAYRDTLSNPAFLQTMHDRLTILRDLLAPTATIIVHLDWHMAHRVRAQLDELLGADHFINEIVWAYKSMNTVRTFYPRKHDTLLWYARGPRWTFNSDAPEVQIPRTNTSWFTDEDGRRYWLKNDKRYYLKTEGKIPEDYWTDIPSLHGPNKQQVGFLTQKPDKLLDRIIGGATNKGDLVLDAYLGSGTTAVSAERLGRRWIGIDLGRFAVHTTRKRLLDHPNCGPFEIMNLGRYERARWQGVDVGEGIAEYFDFIIELYGAQRIATFSHLHGIKDGRMIHVGATDAPVTVGELEEAIKECDAASTLGLDVLGWEWEMGLNPSRKDELAREYGVDVHLLNIPREVMDQKAVDAGDIHFFELSVVELDYIEDDRGLIIEIADFMPAVDDYMIQKVGDAIDRWSDWIDYWSIDFDYDGDTFMNSWQSYRTRQDRSLSLISDPHQYDSPGRKSVVVKVIDIFGNDTTRELTVEVE